MKPKLAVREILMKGEWPTEVRKKLHFSDEMNPKHWIFSGGWDALVMISQVGLPETQRVRNEVLKNEICLQKQNKKLKFKNTFGPKTRVKIIRVTE